MNLRRSSVSERNDVEIWFDCNACKTAGTISPSKAPKFKKNIRVLGIVFAALSFLGFAMGVLIILSAGVSSFIAPLSEKSPEAAGQVLALTLVVLFGVGCCVIAIVCGFLGWLFLLRKKVYKCAKCGFTFDRT